MVSAEQVLQVFLAHPCAKDIIYLHKIRSAGRFHYYAADVLGVRCTITIATWSEFGEQDVFTSFGTGHHDYVYLTGPSCCLLHALVKPLSKRVAVRTPLDHTALFQKVLGV